MKVTKSYIKKLIKEELTRVLKESPTSWGALELVSPNSEKPVQDMPLKQPAQN